MRKFLQIAGIITLVFLIADPVSAIPAFARKYRMSCMTCHAPAPRLKAYGNTFAGNGFRLEDKEAPRYYMDAGDRLLSIIRDFPIAVRMDGFISMEYQKSDEEALTDFRAPFLLKLLSGGEISKHLAYYFYFFMDERGTVAGVEDAYLMYNNLFNIDLDIYMGQFQVSDPLFKRELRLQLEDYHIYGVTPKYSNINLKYDKGIMVILGTNFGTTIVGEVINGNGIVEASDRWQFDKDKYKNFMGRVSQEFGDFLRVGGFAYYGQENLIVQNSVLDKNKAFIWGPDLTINIKGIFELNIQYVQRNDSRVVVPNNPENIYLEPFITEENVVTKGGFAEMIFMPKADESRWYLLGMFNWTDSDRDELDYQSATFHAGYLLRRNVRLVAEETYNFSVEGAEYWTTSLGFVAAF